MDITTRRELWDANRTMMDAITELCRIAQTAIRTDTPEGSEVHARIYSLIHPAQALLNRWYDEHINAPAGAALAADWVDD